MPRWTLNLLVVGILLTLIPLALVTRDRIASHGDRTRISLIPDMDKQPKFKAQEASSFFADGRAARTEPAGTIARGELMADAAFADGRQGGEWVNAFPLAVDAELLARGRERYGIFCAPCHGLAGYGDGIVHERALALAEGGWTPPSSLHTDLVRERPLGQLYNTIGAGIRNMPAYGPQIPPRDRWAIVAYVKALQLSQHARLEDLPAEERARLAGGSGR
jgi:mono/diheme cytochrome c family protein